jgi:hypothetical protein
VMKRAMSPGLAPSHRAWRSTTYPSSMRAGIADGWAKSL